MEKISEQAILESVRLFVETNPTIGELRGISPAELEAVYSLGFNYYRTGKYDEASKIFRFLVIFDHLNAKYWLALGAVQQVQKDYQNAITSYAYSSFLDLHNPKPQFHAAECFLALGDRDNASSALQALEEYCPKTGEPGAEYRAKAAELKKLIEEGKEASNV